MILGVLDQVRFSGSCMLSGVGNGSIQARSRNQGLDGRANEPAFVSHDPSLPRNYIAQHPLIPLAQEHNTWRLQCRSFLRNILGLRVLVAGKP